MSAVAGTATISTKPLNGSSHHNNTISPKHPNDGPTEALGTLIVFVALGILLATIGGITWGIASKTGNLQALKVGARLTGAGLALVVFPIGCLIVEVLINALFDRAVRCCN